MRLSTEELNGLPRWKRRVVRGDLAMAVALTLIIAYLNLMRVFLIFILFLGWSCCEIVSFIEDMRVVVGKLRLRVSRIAIPTESVFQEISNFLVNLLSRTPNATASPLNAVLDSVLLRRTLSRLSPTSNVFAFLPKSVSLRVSAAVIVLFLLSSSI
jgi:hypothetical protein